MATTIAIENKQSVTGLILKLKKAQDQAEKRIIRKALRKLGHKGGLRKRV